MSYVKHNRRVKQNRICQPWRLRMRMICIERTFSCALIRARTARLQLKTGGTRNILYNISIFGYCTRLSGSFQMVLVATATILTINDDVSIPRIVRVLLSPRYNPQNKITTFFWVEQKKNGPSIYIYIHMYNIYICIYIYIYSENQQKPLPVQDHMFLTLVLPQQRAKAQGEPEAGGIFALSAIVEKVLRSCGLEGNYLV